MGGIVLKKNNSSAADSHQLRRPFGEDVAAYNSYDRLSFGHCQHGVTRLQTTCRQPRSPMDEYVR